MSQFTERLCAALTYFSWWSRHTCTVFLCNNISAMLGVPALGVPAKWNTKSVVLFTTCLIMLILVFLALQVAVPFPDRSSYVGEWNVIKTNWKWQVKTLNQPCCNTQNCPLHHYLNHSDVHLWRIFCVDYVKFGLTHLWISLYIHIFFSSKLWISPLWDE